jgi:hypothetical protein
MRPRLPRLVPLLLLLATAAACVPPVPEAQRSCPCTDGWSCCAGVCLPEGDVCPQPPDTTPPAPPRLDAAPGAAPTSAGAVTLSGTAEARARVLLFAHPGCAGAAVADVRADGNGTFAAAGVPLAPEATTRFSARAVDGAGNASDCSPGALAVTHDGTPPPPPVFTDVTPQSPSRTSNQPVLSGSAEPGARVLLYADAGCLVALPFGGVADAQGAFAVWARVAPNTQLTFHAVAVDVAGNASACSPGGLAFTHDDVPPGAATLDDRASPRGPSRQRGVRWVGAAEPLARVRLFSDAACRVVASGDLQVDAAGAWAVEFTATDNGMTFRLARVTDAAGNTGACAELGTYVHDTLPPSAPRLREATEPSSPSNSPALAVRGTAEPAARVRLYTAEDCAPSGEVGAVGEVRADAFSVFRAELAVAQEVTRFWATAEDLAGNVSECSHTATTYVWDTAAPAPPTHLLFGDVPPGDAPRALRLFGRTADGNRVEVFDQDACGEQGRVGASVANPTPVEGRDVPFVAEVYSPLSPWRAYWARAVDAAGNPSACVPAGGPVRAAPGEREWGAPEKAPLPFAALGTDGAGALYALGNHWGEIGGWGLELHRRTGGRPWERVHTVASGGTPVAYWQLAVGAAGDLLAGWMSAGRLHVSRFSAATGAWEEAVLEAQGPLLEPGTLALAPDGTAWACWARQPQGAAAPQVGCASAAPGEGWRDSGLTLTGPFDGPPRLLPSTGGRARLVWAWLGAPGGGERRVHARGFTPGAGWDAPVLLADPATAPSTAVGSDGTAWMAYAAPAGAGASWQVRVRRSAPGETAWGAAELLSSPAHPFLVSIRAGAAGEAVLSWSEDLVGEPERPRLQVRQYAPAGGWGAAVGVPLAGLGDTFAHPVLAAEAGRAWVVWEEWASVPTEFGTEERVDLVLARPVSRDAGVGPARVLASSRAPIHWLRTTGAPVADASGRVAVPLALSDGTGGTARVLRVLE